MTQHAPAQDDGKQQDSKQVPFWRGEWASFAMMILLLTVARTSFANHYQVPSGSMEPTLMPAALRLRLVPADRQPVAEPSHVGGSQTAGRL